VVLWALLALSSLAGAAPFQCLTHHHLVARWHSNSPHPPTNHLNRHVQQPIPLPLSTRRRQPTPADINLQRLVDEPWLGKCRVTLGAPAHKVFLGRPCLEVLVVRALVGNG
jgi:hypothetical protein